MGDGKQMFMEPQLQAGTILDTYTYAILFCLMTDMSIFFLHLQVCV